MSTTPTLRDAAQRDALLQASLDFISTLTGMTPPPIEVAPPEVFAPFFAFVDRVQEITAPAGAALTQGAGEAVDPVAWPRDAAEVRQFMNSNCEAVEFAVDEATPDDGDRYKLTAHDFLSAVNWWADFPHYPSEDTAQQLQQAVAREREECAAICERAVDSIWEYHEDNHKRTGRNVCTNLAAAIRAKGTHD